MSNLVNPLNFKQWIEDNRDKLKPPVCNEVVWRDQDFIVMVVGGPNTRKDYHYNETPEFFHQIEGDMILKVIDNGEFKDISIKEGEIFLLPPKVPHSPQRLENTVGLVLEQVRPDGVLDGLSWYCENCNHEIYNEKFALDNIVTQMQGIFEKFFANKEYRTCEKCNTIMEVPKK